MKSSVIATSRALLTCFLISFTYMSSASTAAQPKAPISQVSLTNGLENESSCNLSTTSIGTATSIQCDYPRIVLRVKSMPSTSTILLTSSRSCSEDTQGQDWWVKLQATNRITSTPNLAVFNVLEDVLTWKKDPSQDFVAPYLKIVGGDVKKLSSGSANVGCAALNPAFEAADRGKVIHFLMSPIKEAADYKPWIGGTCGDQIMANLYLTGKYGFSYQCVQPVKFDGAALKLSNFEEHQVSIDDGPMQCSTGKIISTLMSQRFYNGKQHFKIICGSLVDSSGRSMSLTQLPNPKWVKRDGRFSACENDRPDPAQVQPIPLAVWTGFDADSDSNRMFCSKLVTGN